MDNLTHGLLGLAIGALRRPDGGPGTGRPFSATDKAVLCASLVAAELPDLDTLLPAANEAMHALHAHRGISHAIVVTPLWALVATGLACALFRGARALPTFGFALGAVLFAHLAPDLWTGWGTRALLPFTDARLHWDLTGVVDPLVTLPLLAGLIFAWVKRASWRKALTIGLAVSCAYLGFRGISREIVKGRLEAAYPTASRIEVFPSLLSAHRWRWVAEVPEGYEAGVAQLFGAVESQRRIPMSPPLPADLGANEAVREALAWARLPTVSVEPLEDGGHQVRIADLRYHLGGEPTLSIVVDVDREGATRDARLDRGGTSAEIVERWKSSR
ncbi:metal-dependent hydrolase [Vulgatibacter incomptus]|uniref:Membrane-bound metal-dependent hydrolase n=1 Tax=Vulgatibacter incomptus TaxID=1391653 RepID=A0A0K1PGH7_9BACT|nr:metal-dependent hydrolase [Vulgatibacter incomptus]AKU92612.1 Membrane-bound metal-dependent hydrolase [Vulgatibacter incomptus]